jgi:hypothetical protein
MHTEYPFLWQCALPHLAAFTFGIAAHLSFWIRYELDGWINWILLCSFLLHHAFAFLILSLTNQSLVTAYVYALRLELSHLFGLALSISIYRVFFHRLRRFPGQIGSALSVFGRAWVIFLSGERATLLTHALHLKHGDVVRTGDWPLRAYEIVAHNVC